MAEFPAEVKPGDIVTFGDDPTQFLIGDIERDEYGKIIAYQVLRKPEQNFHA